jgi:hypothetical protein
MATATNSNSDDSFADMGIVYRDHKIVMDDVDDGETDDAAAALCQSDGDDNRSHWITMTT